eukprot:gene4098-4782_t
MAPDGRMSGRSKRKYFKRTQTDPDIALPPPFAAPVPPPLPPPTFRPTRPPTLKIVQFRDEINEAKFKQRTRFEDEAFISSKARTAPEYVIEHASAQGAPIQAADMTEEEKIRRNYIAYVLIQDAILYRDPNHVLDRRHLVIYQIYFYWAVRLFIFCIDLTLLSLAYFEMPTNHRASSDALLSIELGCILVLFGDLALKKFFYGEPATKNKWNWFRLFFLSVNLIDIIVAYILVASGVRPVRVSRIFRVYYIIDFDRLTRDLFLQVMYTLYRMAPVGIAFFSYIFLSSIMFSIIFSNGATDTRDYYNSTLSSFLDSMVLITTANFPNIMFPAYAVSKWYAVVFILYLSVGLYIGLNFIIALVYHSFRNAVLRETKNNFRTRRTALLAAFIILDHDKTGVIAAFDLIDTDANGYLNVKEFFAMCDIFLIERKTVQMMAKRRLNASKRAKALEESQTSRGVVVPNTENEYNSNIHSMISNRNIFGGSTTTNKLSTMANRAALKVANLGLLKNPNQSQPLEPPSNGESTPVKKVYPKTPHVRASKMVKTASTDASPYKPQSKEPTTPHASPEDSPVQSPRNMRSFSLPSNPNLETKIDMPPLEFAEIIDPRAPVASPTSSPQETTSMLGTTNTTTTPARPKYSLLAPVKSRLSYIYHQRVMPYIKSGRLKRFTKHWAFEIAVFILLYFNAALITYVMVHTRSLYHPGWTLVVDDILISIIFVVYYVYSVIGIWLYEDLFYRGNEKLIGSDYDQQDFYLFANFNSFNSAMITLFHLMVVNNWFVTFYAAILVTSAWSILYFCSFYFLSVVCVLNLVVAFLIEAVNFTHNFNYESQKHLAKVKKHRHRHRILRRQGSTGSAHSKASEGDTSSGGEGSTFRRRHRHRMPLSNNSSVAGNSDDSDDERANEDERDNEAESPQDYLLEQLNALKLNQTLNNDDANSVKDELHGSGSSGIASIRPLIRTSNISRDIMEAPNEHDENNNNDNVELSDINRDKTFEDEEEEDDDMINPNVGLQIGNAHFLEEKMFSKELANLNREDILLNEFMKDNVLNATARAVAKTTSNEHITSIIDRTTT